VFQVPFSEQIRKEVAIKTQAVGLIRDYDFANSILVDGKADLVALGRQHLFDPYWTNHAREYFGKTKNFQDWPTQYSWWLNNWKKSLSDINESP
jgi:2,4-dienoyl-CoA reductase-like NADH-dependent reductase (Old Yellow Enzyme family)